MDRANEKLPDLSNVSVEALKELCDLLFERLSRAQLHRAGQAPKGEGTENYLRAAMDARRLAQIALLAAIGHVGVAKGRTEGN